MICSSPGCGNMPSPTRMPRPPAFRNAWWTLEMPFTTPAIPTVSCGLPHHVPKSETPPETVRSISVKSQGSTVPSAQPARAKTPKSSEMLFQVEAQSWPAGIVADRVDVGESADDRRKVYGVLELACAAATEKARDLDLSWLSPQRVALLDLADHLKLLEGGIEILAGGAYAAGGCRRQVEYPATQRPAALVPLGGHAVSVVPAITRRVECAGIDERPAQEVAFWIVSIFVHVENIEDVELAGCDHEAICRRCHGEVVEVRLNHLAAATESNSLPDVIALQPRVRIGRPDLEGLGAWKSGCAVRVRKAEALIELRLNP